MELRHFRLVEAVAKTGTLSQAGKILNLTQSALSHQLKEIEKELETPLFFRLNRRLVLSEAGRIMLESASIILTELDEVKAKVNSHISSGHGEIALSTHCYTCYHWLPKVLRSFEREEKRISIKIKPEYTRDPLPGLLNGDLDLVITQSQWDEKTIEYRELFWDEQVVVVSARHPWAIKSYIDGKDFAEEKLIIYYGPLEDSTIYRKVLGPLNLKPLDVIEMQLTEAAIELIKSNMGVKVMASWAIRPYLNDHDLCIKPITKNGLFRTWYLAYHKNAGWCRYYDSFRTQLIQEMKQSNDMAN